MPRFCFSTPYGLWIPWVVGYHSLYLKGELWCWRTFWGFAFYSQRTPFWLAYLEFLSIFVQFCPLWFLTQCRLCCLSLTEGMAVGFCWPGLSLVLCTGPWVFLVSLPLVLTAVKLCSASVVNLGQTFLALSLRSPLLVTGIGSLGLDTFLLLPQA